MICYQLQSYKIYVKCRHIFSFLYRNISLIHSFYHIFVKKSVGDVDGVRISLYICNKSMIVEVIGDV